MNAPLPAIEPLSLQDWLDRLCSASDHHDALSVGVKAIAAGYALERVTCDVCTPRMVHTFAGAVRHIRQTEAAWRDAHGEDGPNAALHRPGDLRAAKPADIGRPPSPWSASPCRYCRRQIVWASTKTGKRMPVDAQPDPAGNVLLTLVSITDPPLAMVVHTDEQRAEIDPDDLHTSHMQTCPNRPPR